MSKDHRIYSLSTKYHNRKETVERCCPWYMPNTAKEIQLWCHKPKGTFLLTPIIDSIFDCVIQSRDVREDWALKQPEKLSPSPITCPDGKRLFRTLCPGVSRSVFKTEGPKETSNRHLSQTTADWYLSCRTFH